MKEILKKLYDAIPLKKQLFETVRFFGVPPYSVYKHLHFTGIIKLKVDKKAWFKMQHHGTEIENDLFWKGLTGGWEKISMQYWIELSRSSKKSIGHWGQHRSIFFGHKICKSFSKRLCI